MASPLITDAELIEITGHKQPGKQCRALEDHGVIFFKDKDGKPHTTWYNFNHPKHLRGAILLDDEPDFAAMSR